MTSGRSDDRGLTESVQLAVVFPLLMLLILGIIEGGLWLHGRNVAHRAATAAVDVARGSYGSPTEARELAVSLAEAGGLRGVTVDVSDGPVDVRVVVRATAPTLLDLGLGRLDETAAAPRERVTQP